MEADTGLLFEQPQRVAASIRAMHFESFMAFGHVFCQSLERIPYLGNQIMKKRIFIVTLLLVAFGATSCRRNASVWNDPEMWYRSEKVIDTAGTDVLYFVSTDVLSAEDKDGTAIWRTALSPEDRDAISGEMAWVERNMFHTDFNFFAPYYHQFTFDALSELDSAGFTALFKDVADEACDAFDHYMEKINGGRQFIIAGFSQGAMLTLEVLKHMTDEQYSRMVACYTLGYRLTEGDLQHPHIKAAEGPDDRGVVISFNSTATRDAIWHFVSDGAAACINPVNWKTDTTAASFCFKETDNTVRIDPQDNVLMVETDSLEYFHSYYEAAPFYLDAGVSPDNLHHWDLLFYAGHIHDNAVMRSKKYQKTSATL